MWIVKQCLAVMCVFVCTSMCKRVEKKRISIVFFVPLMYLDCECMRVCLYARNSESIVCACVCSIEYTCATCV